MKINCIVIDDQKESVELLTSHIGKIPELSLMLATTSPVDGINFLGNQKIDLIFLDVEMPDLTGIEFIETLKEKYGKDTAKFILTTGSDHYALTGYDYGVFDYLLKPISFKRFKISVDRFLFDLHSKLDLQKKEQTVALAENLSRIDFIFIETDAGKIKLNYSEILYIEADRNYLDIFTTASKVVVYNSLNSIEEKLSSSDFIRIHRSFIINIKKIIAIKGNDLVLLTSKAETLLPIGKTYRNEVFKRLQI